MSRQRICVVTGSRAEYGLLYWVLHDLRADPGVELQIVATGMHLAPEYGLTVREIESDGFTVTRRVEMLLSSDTPGGVAKSMGLGVIGLSDALLALAPDVALVLGDRFEILAAAQACLIHKIPLAHIAGGDVTEGAFDESIRHAITKMAQVHFVTNEDAARRVCQMGEDPARVHVVGSPGLDHLHRRPLLGRPELEASLGAPLGAKNLLVTFHPVTLDEHEGMGELDALLGALAATPPDTHLWFTRPNADTGSRAISARLDSFAAQHAGRVKVYTSLGQLRYLSLMAQVDVVVGNSSSGLYEAPSFGVPTVNLGDRQRGRLAAASVLHCRAEQSAIADALQRALALDCTGVVNPYGDGHSAPRIVRVLRSLPPAAALLRKPFHSIA
jgi:UDP-N-acetylglucosamine 2-epimerase (non-hydrolysing)/GDP/UDP-N,N'-diacetylbacillosamine 2-epimerase (hydrolysing)